jgi:exocyst complex component 4
MYCFHRRFVFEGLDTLMEHSLVSNAIYIRNLNKNGVMKMTRNILALQQNLNNIVETPGEISLERARRYYEMFNMGPVVCVFKFFFIKLLVNYNVKSLFK